MVTLHAVGTAFGGWLILQENYTKQEHGQDLLLPMGMAWFVALICWGLAVFQGVCVVRAWKRRPWVRVAFAVLLSFTVLSTAVGFLGSLAAGAPAREVLVILGLDVAALWVLFGESARGWFSPHSAASTAAIPPAASQQ
jgi:hypothetical protein